MTLIVGIKCADGIVLGADGAATYGVMGQRTIRQTHQKKLSILKSRIIVGVSGSVGLGQRYEGVVEQLWDQKAFSGQKPWEAMTLLRENFWKHQAFELNAANVSKGVHGPGPGFASATTAVIVALPLSSTPHLFQFDQQGAPEEMTEQLPFASIGSGQPNADPFLAFLRRLLWPDTLPTLQQGVMTALWTLDHCIEVSPGGIADPVQVVTLGQGSGGLQAKELSEEELNEHREAIKGAEGALKQFVKGQPTEEEGEPPDVPKPKDKN